MPPLNTALKKLLALLAITAVWASTAAVLLKTGLLQQFENESWDLRAGVIATYTKADPSIKIILIDENSLAYVAREEQLYWPWPRELYVPVLEYLRTASAKGIAFDLDFNEPSHHGLEDDSSFGLSMREGLPVVLSLSLQQGTLRVGEAELETFKLQQTKANADSKFETNYLSPSSPKFPNVMLPVQQLLRSAHGLGAQLQSKDPDGVSRRIHAGYYLDDTPVLSIPFALYHAANPQSVADGFSNGRSHVVRFSGKKGSYTTYSFSDVFRSYQMLRAGEPPLIPLQEFKDSYVFLATDAPGLQNVLSTPFSKTFPSVEASANVLDNILHGTFIDELSKKANFMIAATSVLLITLFTLFLPHGRPVRRANVLFLLIVICGGFLCGILGVWMHFVVPIVCSTGAWLAAYGVRYQVEVKKRNRLERIFHHSVSPRVLATLVAQAGSPTIPEGSTELSFFACKASELDLLASTLEPAQCKALLSCYQNEITKIVFANGGTIDQCHGGVISAFWNAPLLDLGHASKAMATALECKQRVKVLQNQLATKAGREFHLHMGMHTGMATIGEYGCALESKYTVIGEVKYVAPILMNANSTLGTDILISGSAYKLIAPEVRCIRVTPEMKGVPEIYTPSSGLTLSEIHLWNAALGFYAEGRLEEANIVLNQLTHSQLPRKYLQKISQIKEGRSKLEWELGEIPALLAA